MFAVIKSILTLSCYSVICLSSLVAHAAPRLVTPKLPPGIQGQVYAASLLIGSALPLSSANVAGLPGGLTATHNGVGSIAISGTPTVSGNFALNVAAADNAAGMLNTSVNLTISPVRQGTWANNVFASLEPFGSLSIRIGQAKSRALM